MFHNTNNILFWLQEETNLAVKYIEIVLNMVHTSETAKCISNNSKNILYKTTLFSSCPDHRCLSHELFGMHKNATESTYFLNVGASELRNIEVCFSAFLFPCWISLL